VEDVLIRGWENFIARTTGPLKFRFILQPTVAAVLGALAGLRDYRAGRPAFFWSLLTEGSRRHLSEIFRDVGRIFLISMAMDAVYQLFVSRGIFLLELLFTALILAVVPYLLIRGPANRLFRTFHLGQAGQDERRSL